MKLTSPKNENRIRPSRSSKVPDSLSSIQVAFPAKSVTLQLISTPLKIISSALAVKNIEVGLLNMDLMALLTTAKAPGFVLLTVLTVP